MWHDCCVPLALVAGLVFSASLESYAVGRAADSQQSRALVVLARSKTLGNTQPSFVDVVALSKWHLEHHERS